ncbi:ArsR family transcriptional regulator [Jiangella ureilytica]|uniref:ArsR family transcriptional regulator n=1 Tax=Jiangella ureilytica TaxID=2530374 RepID=A0A4R4RVK0_9ACTN|nr:helix-turn-helix domain-containing protein [Jiangella ureilytica]TDC52593.1 ArsR family transcriptional regulator [Jiangella ureilytica]
MTIDDEVAAVAATPAELVEYQLDIAYRGRTVPAAVAASVGGPARLEELRQPMPAVVAEALAGGPAAFAARVAAAMRTYFACVLEPDWPRVLDVLTADVAYRGDRMAQHGALALLDDFHPSVRWDDGAVVVRKPFDLVVDWPYDGLLLIPSTGVGDGVLLNAERPTTPSILYPARGLHALWSVPGGADAERGTGDLGELIGHTRAPLMAALDTPRTTAELGRREALTPATVSYHLAILHRTGLVSRRRSGRRVVYSRTDLAAALLGAVRNGAPSFGAGAAGREGHLA